MEKLQGQNSLKQSHKVCEFRQFFILKTSYFKRKIRKNSDLCSYRADKWCIFNWNCIKNTISTQKSWNKLNNACMDFISARAVVYLRAPWAHSLRSVDLEEHYQNSANEIITKTRANFDKSIGCQGLHFSEKAVL